MKLSRPTVYAVGAAAESVLRNHFETPLLSGVVVDVRVDDAQLRRTVVALRVLAPNAIRPIEDLVPLLYRGVKVSYGAIQQMLVEVAGRAGRFNAQAALGGVEAGALDEMFSQSEPVLAGVGLWTQIGPWLGRGQMFRGHGDGIWSLRKWVPCKNDSEDGARQWV